MLQEEQVAELLQRAEEAAGRVLNQVRGNLAKPQSRAAAIWELLVFEAALELGAVEYEPGPNGSPDIRLTPPGGRPIWVEVAFLYPRFWEDERKSGAVRRWLYEAARKRGIESWKLYIRLDGDREDLRGPVRKLPLLHEQKEFLRKEDVRAFLEAIRDEPEKPRALVVSGYSVAVSYLPEAKGPYTASGGLEPEAPKTVEEHAVYRVLRSKAKQHDVEGPRVICVGSDQSPALSRTQGPMTPTVREAVGAAFSRHRSLSAAFVVPIEDRGELFSGFRKEARARVYWNELAKEPLTDSELKLLAGLNFNRWALDGRHEKWESGPPSSRHLHGRIKWSWNQMSLKTSIPVGVVADALAGKTSVGEAYGEDHDVAKALREGWTIVSSKVEAGDVQQGEPAMLELTLVPPGLAPMWPPKTK